ncbi:MAG: cytochrome b6-f complex subunit 6 [Cyanobium sp. CZS 25K]|nr:cytochrome b6-f complex subunit 6 [Cyanobium sp. CZS25K]
MRAFLAAAAVGVVIYLALVGGGLTAAFLATVVLKGVRLI